MAIKLKDWGMIPTPANQASLRTSGINDLASARQSLAQGVQRALDGLGSLAEEKEKIKQTGELAKLSRDITNLNEEVHDEMQDLPPDNWEYQWNRASQARIKDLVDQLPEGSRELGGKVALALNQRASVESRSKAELAQIQESERMWLERLQLAEQECDEQKCELWLNSGRGQFFAESDFERKQVESRERCLFNRWQNRLDQEPLAALAELNEAEQAPIAQNSELHPRFKDKLQAVRQGTQAELGELLWMHLREGAELHDEQFELAYRAQIITPKQFEQASKGAPSKSEPYALCRWRKAIDEFDPGDESRFTQLKIDLGTAELALRDKQGLIKRLDALQEVALSDRRSLSRSIWNIYESGMLGARHDENSIKRLQALQEEGLEHILQAGADDTAQWLQSRKKQNDCWICFSPQDREKTQRPTPHLT